MKTIQTENGKQTIIMQKGDYTLLATYYRATGEFREYVVAWLYNQKGCWGQGHYFWHDLAGAIDYFKSQTEQNYISRRRLEEIATVALHGLVDEEVYDVYEDDLYLEPNEIEYFGIETGNSPMYPSTKDDSGMVVDDLMWDEDEVFHDDSELVEFVRKHQG